MKVPLLSEGGVDGAVEEEVGRGFKVTTVAVKGGAIFHPPMVSSQGASAKEELTEVVIPSTLGPD